MLCLNCGSAAANIFVDVCDTCRFQDLIGFSTRLDICIIQLVVAHGACLPGCTETGQVMHRHDATKQIICLKCRYVKTPYSDFVDCKVCYLEDLLQNEANKRSVEIVNSD